MARFITIKNEKVVAIRNADYIVAGEMESDIGNIGEVLIAGKFTAPVEVARPIINVAEELRQIKAIMQAVNEKLIAIETTLKA